MTTENDPQTTPDDPTTDPAVTIIPPVEPIGQQPDPWHE
jgi:hypothetical protein